jgi:mRNA-degrading endonuclease RelE of RelBE toxin-antitoxin system
MISHTTASFRKAFRQLPEQLQRQAREAYKRFQQDPFHSSLQFKQIHPTKPVYSVRVGRDYRAVGVRNRDEIIWYWIGSHSDYDKLISQL